MEKKIQKQQIILLIFFIFIIAYIPKITAHNNLPNLGNETQTIITPKEEILIGKVWLHQLQHAGFVSKELIINTYLQNIGNYLVNTSFQQDLKKFNFFMVEQPDINAFAFMGGNIGIFAGLINFTDTESELAAIMSHEISHVTQKHFARELLHQKRLTPITIIEAITMAAIGIPDLIVPVLGGHIQQMLHFSRLQEQEADHFAVELLTRSAFDPLAMGNILTKMDKINNISNDQNISKYLLTHPLFKERIFEAYTRVNKSSYKQYANSIDYQLIKIIINNKLNNNKTDILNKINQKLKIHDYHNELTLLFEKAINLKTLHQYSKAKKILTKLATQNPHNLIIQISLAELLLTNQPDLSKKKLENLIDIFPDHLPLVITYAKALIMLNEVLKAKQILDPFNKEHLEDLLEEPQIYELLIACNQKLNNLDEALLVQAKLMVINHQLDAAEQKIDSALKQIKQIQQNRNDIYYRLNKFKKELKQYKENITAIKL